MDIKNELEEIMINDKNADDLVENINNQRNELLKKAHLLKVISCCQKLEKFIDKIPLLGKDIGFLDLEYIYTGASGGKIDFSLTTKDQLYAIVNLNITDIVKNAIEPIDGFPMEFVNDRFIGIDYSLELKAGISEQILDLFLSDELKKVYDYSLMQIELSHNDNNNKRLKV